MASSQQTARVDAESACAPIRPIRFAPVEVERITSADGSILFRSKIPLEPCEQNFAKMFRAAVERVPSRICLAERSADGWRKIAYEEARQQIDSIAAALIERGLSAERPVMILSGNAIDHALLMLAGCTAGIPVAPISVAYSLQSQDFGKLKHIYELLTPGLIYVADTAPFAKALSALNLANTEIVASGNTANFDAVTPFASLARTHPGLAVEAAVAAITPDTIAKFLFTSGSTGLPKAVINTNRMLTVNQQQLAQVWPFVSEQPLVLVDWLPWNHTFGGNHNFNMVLRHAGTLYIDAGKPLPAIIGETVRNLTEVSPTIYFNVPSGFAALLPYLEKDAAFARTFFANLRMIFYAGAALPQDIWSRLEAMAVRTTGMRIPMTSSWGTTETAPAATAAHYLAEQAGIIGVPLPGVDIKLTPVGSKTEIRVRGPNVSPGYWRQPELTSLVYDEDGFYKPGDAVRFADSLDPAKGVIFDGRLAEDFKLTTGTWVPVGGLRIGILSVCSPVLQDAVIAGENREFVAILAWLNSSGCRTLFTADVPDSPVDLAGHPAVRQHIASAVARWNAEQKGSSTRVMRVLVLINPPSIDANEITDKGYINQRLALERRKADVERLFAPSPDPEVIVI